MGHNAWLVDYPFAPWRWKQADEERRGLLERLLDSDTACGFHVTDEHWETVSEAIAEEDRPLPTPWPWVFVRAGETGRAVDLMYEGEWVLFLFRRLPIEPPTVPAQFDPTDPGILTELARQIGATACVYSYPDDREWLIVDAVPDSAPLP